MENIWIEKQTLVEEKILQEEKGINDDVITLSFFLERELTNRSFPLDSTIMFNRQNLPKTLNLNIAELNIYHPNCNKKFTNEFNLTTSYQMENGEYVINLALCTIDDSTIYHEINHVLQFILRGKANSLSSSYREKASKISETIINNQVIKKFINILVKSREGEINALVAETYPLIQNITDINVGKKIIENSNAYQISNELIHYNIFNEFKTVTEFECGVFFENVNVITKALNSGENNDEILKRTLGIITILNDGNFKAPYQNITNNRMTKYQKLFQYRGNKLRNKLYRLLSFTQQ